MLVLLSAVSHPGLEMKFLITNDDGFGAPGIRLLASVAANFGEVTIVAPVVEQSGISHRISFEKPLQLVEKQENGYTVDGTPADCVRVALSLWNEFDCVLSGMNNGANLGVDVYYSGTVAAAREAAFFGLPAIAFSQYRANYTANNSYDFENTKPLLTRLLKDLLGTSPASEILNVNLPDRASTTDPAEIDLVRCPVDPSPLPADFRRDENKLVYSAVYADRPKMPGMDTDVCFGGNVSISKMGF